MASIRASYPRATVDEVRSRPQLTVVGAGVIGLTVANELCEHGFDVEIIARDMPFDETSSMQWASPWAGANWCSYADESLTRVQRWERTTWHRWMDIHKKRPDMIDLVPIQHELEASQSTDVWFKDLVPKFEVDTQKHTLHYESFCVDVPSYLCYLYETLLEQQKQRGCRVTFRRVPTVESLAHCLSTPPSLTPASSPSVSPERAHSPTATISTVTTATSTSSQEVPTIVVNCTSSGSRSLPEAGEDDCLYGALGQTVLVRIPPSDQQDAPAKTIPMRIRPGGSFTSSCRGISPLRGDSEQIEDRDAHSFTYIIPRARSGTVILGGTFVPFKFPRSLNSSTSHNWLEWSADEEQTKRIVEQCLEWEPRLGTVSATGEQTVDIVSVGLGVRPMRKGGARIERGTFPHHKAGRDEIVHVVHAYGLGGSGYQQSWGVASDVRSLVEEILVEEKVRRGS